MGHVDAVVVVQLLCFTMVAIVDDDDRDDEDVIEVAAITAVGAVVPAEVDVNVNSCQYFCCS